MKPRYRKSWAGNLLMWSDLTLDPCFKVKRGEPNLKGFITYLLLILEVCNMKPTCRILWAGNLPMSDLTFGPSFKVKQWSTDFGELSFRWIQICIGSPMRRSSLTVRWNLLGTVRSCLLKTVQKDHCNQQFCWSWELNQCLWVEEVLECVIL